MPAPLLPCSLAAETSPGPRPRELPDLVKLTRGVGPVTAAPAQLDRLAPDGDRSDADRARRREFVARTRAEQGLPPTVEDPVTLDRIAEVFRLVRAAEDAQDAA